MAVPTPWRVVDSLTVMHAQLNALWPNRAKGSDGAIAGPNATPSSDHWPHRVPALGGGYVVTARDITHDPYNGPDGEDLAEALRASRDPRIKYVIWNRRIFSNPAHSHAELDWRWRPYTGASPHTDHVHVSVRDLPSADSTAPWQLSTQDGGAMELDTPVPNEGWTDVRPDGSTFGPQDMNVGQHLVTAYRNALLAKEWARATYDKVAALESGGITAEAVAGALLDDPRFPSMLEQAIGSVIARVGLVVRSDENW